MATKTNFLELTLPDNGEYVDNWDTVVNANFEELDGHVETVHTDLVGATGNTSSLKGSTSSLEERLDEGLNSDGTPNLDNSPDFEALTRSEVYPVGASSDQGKKVRQRFNQAEVEVAKLRAASDTDRFGASGSPEALTGLAKLAAQYQDVSDGIQSPVRGFVPNTVVAGPATGAAPNYLSRSSNAVTIKDGTVINIDGFYFEVDGDMTVDFTDDISSVPGPTTYYLFASRLSADYSTVNLTTIYGSSLGGTYALDQRIIPAHPSQRSGTPSNPTTGSISDTDLDRFSTTGNSFSSYNVRPGDILRIVTDTNGMDGDYIIKTVVDAENLDIFGEFQLPPATSSVTAQEHYIWRPTTPVLGISDNRDYTAGRVYIGEVDITANAMTAMRMYAIGGIYDSGWENVDSFSWGSAVDHFLGTIPSQMEIWVKNAASGSEGTIEKDPTVLIAIDGIDDQGGSTFTAEDVRVPAMRSQCSKDDFKVSYTDPKGSGTVYTDYDGTDVANTSSAHSIRVIVRR